MRSAAISGAKSTSIAVTLRLCLFLLLLVSPVSTSAGYNAYQTARYADKWVDPYGTKFRNGFFKDWSDEGGDCANFVSQCLMAGYVQTYRGTCDDRHSIVYCDYLHGFLKDKLGSTPERVYSGSNPPDDIVSGDVVIYGSTGDEYAHAVIVTFRDESKTEVNSHTREAYHVPFSAFFGDFTFATCYHIPSNAGVGADLAPALSNPLVFSNSAGGSPQTPLYASPCYTFADMRVGNLAACDIPDAICVRLYYGFTPFPGEPQVIPGLLYDQIGAISDYAFLMPDTQDRTVWMSVDDTEYWAETNEGNNFEDRTDYYYICIDNPEIYATAFEATPTGRAVILSWKASPRSELIAFLLSRASEGQEPARLVEVRSDWETNTSAIEQKFIYVDGSVEAGRRYTYLLDAVFANGNVLPVATTTVFVAEVKGIVTSCPLPNPFSRATSIRFEIDTPSEVCVSIYDVRGCVVRAFPKECRQAGKHNVMWNGTDNSGALLPPGLYICRICAGKDCNVVKTVLIR